MPRTAGEFCLIPPGKLKQVARATVDHPGFRRGSIGRCARQIEQARGVSAGLIVVETQRGGQRFDALLPCRVGGGLGLVSGCAPGLPQRNGDAKLWARLMGERHGIGGFLDDTCVRGDGFPEALLLNQERRLPA